MYRNVLVDKLVGVGGSGTSNWADTLIQETRDEFKPVYQHISAKNVWSGGSDGQGYDNSIKLSNLIRKIGDVIIVAAKHEQVTAADVTEFAKSEIKNAFETKIKNIDKDIEIIVKAAKKYEKSTNAASKAHQWQVRTKTDRGASFAKVKSSSITMRRELRKTQKVFSKVAKLLPRLWNESGALDKLHLLAGAATAITQSVARSTAATAKVAAAIARHKVTAAKSKYSTTFAERKAELDGRKSVKYTYKKLVKGVMRYFYD